MPSIITEAVGTPGAPSEPTTPSVPGANWGGSAGCGRQYKGADGTPLKGSCWIEAEQHRYLFDAAGRLVTGRDAVDGGAISVDADGDVSMGGDIYYLNPVRNPAAPRTCYVVTDYICTRPNNEGLTCYEADGVSFTGWMKSGGTYRYQTSLTLPGRGRY